MRQYWYVIVEVVVRSRIPPPPSADCACNASVDVLEKTLWLITNISLIPANRRQMHSIGYLSALCNLLSSPIQLQVIDILRNILQDRMYCCCVCVSVFSSLDD
jgi:hypothetical protein